MNRKGLERPCPPRCALGLVSLLAACGPQLDPREGRWQGTCSPDGRSPSEANVTMELELIDDLQSAGAALVDRGFGPEPG